MPFSLDLPLDWTTGVFAAPSALILAYLDPGTGSFALQILLATLFGGMFALKQSWAELKIWLSSRFGAKSSTSTKPDAARPATPIRSQDIARPGVHAHQTAKVQ
jgi:hypothetical protein